MKHIKIVFTFILLFTLHPIFSQTLTEERKERIITALSDTNASIRMSALFDIIEFKIVEAEDSLIQKIWSDELLLQPIYLEALMEINSSVTYDYAANFINKMDSLYTQKQRMGYLEYKVEAIGVLFALNDYSKANEVFELINAKKPRIDFTALTLLKDIIINSPGYEEQAKIELIYAAQNASLVDDRLIALRDLHKIYEEGSITNLIESFMNDSEGEVRLTVLLNYLSKYNNAELIEVYKQRLLEESYGAIRIDISKELLQEFGSPENYKFILEYIEQEVNETVKHFINNEVESFKPVKPDSSTSETEMIDSLISYNHQSFSYGWIPDTLTYDTLSLKLSLIEADIDTELWTDALNKTNDYLLYVENALSQNAINDDAYKFLRYYGEYIKERLGLWQQ
ncbi:MAG: hypothetical protein PVH88_12145 [Ignavibacteria bacterium]